MRWILYLLSYLILQVITYIITPILPLFAVRREGWTDNASVWTEGWKLPKWFSWFDTPDNSLDGDANHINTYIWHPQYLRHLFWLYRNSLYGFKWTVLAMDVQDTQIVTGNFNIGYQGSRFGVLHIRQPNGAWQFKIVKPILGKIFEGNFGWLLDDTTKQRALFMFSPRIKGIQND